ncbi:MAG: VTT domain-containing protein [Candidatus Thorarchaeota archaeon]
MRISDRLLLISVVVLAVYLILSIIDPNLISPFGAVYVWILEIAFILGYPGVFIISALGNATVLIPIPYIGFAFVLGGLQDQVTSTFLFDPLIVGLVGGLGAMLGEMTGYLIGYEGGRFIDEKQTSAFKQFVDSHPRATPFVVWFLAATPIPDDVLIVPLGAARYSWWKVALAQFIGKSMFLILIAWSGRIGLVFIGSIIGGMNTMSFFSRIIEVSSLFLVILAIYLLVRIDWTSMIDRTESHSSSSEV